MGVAWGDGKKVKGKNTVWLVVGGVPTRRTGLAVVSLIKSLKTCIRANPSIEEI